MIKLDYNIVGKDVEERLRLLPEKNKKLYDECENYRGKVKNLLCLKKSKEVPRVGDAFILSYIEGEYLYGLVLETFQNWETNVQVVAIFNITRKERKLDDVDFSEENLFFPPTIVFDGYWKKGFFETIANISLQENDININYGFFKTDAFAKTGCFVDSNGNYINYIPKFYDIYGVCTIWGIYGRIWFELLFTDKAIDYRK